MSLAKLLLDDKRYRWFLYGMVLLGGISFLLMFYLIWLGIFSGLVPNMHATPGRDFYALYHRAVAFSGGEVIDFIYFPLTIFYYLPLTHLSFYQAFFLITLLNLLMALVIATLATKILGYYHIKLPRAGKWLIFLAYIFFCPVTASLNSANVNTLAACFIAMFFYFLCVRNRNVYAGLSLVVATLFKIFPAALLLFAVVQRRFKFILAFLLMLALCCGISVLLLGVPAHVDWVESLLFTGQGGARLTASANSAISGIVYKSLELFNIQGTAWNIINISWLFIRMAFVLSILGYLYPLYRKGREALRDTEWSILLFSLFCVMMVALPNRAWVYYTSCLVLPFILCILCLKLSPLEKTLLALSLAFFSFNIHIHNISRHMGGVFYSLVYLVHPSVMGNLLFLAFVLLKMVRLKRRSYYPQTTEMD